MPTKTRFMKGEIRLELGERASYRFSVLSARQVARTAGFYLNKFGLTGNTWRVLSIIAYYGPMSATEVCRHGSLEPDKVTRAVDLLVHKGYVSRRQDRKDRRKVVLACSAKGRRVFDEIERVRYAMETELMSALEPDELDALYAILDKLDRRAEEIFVQKDIVQETLISAGNAKPARAVASQNALRGVAATNPRKAAAAR